MASMSVSEEDLSCPVCCDIFKDPVLLQCSHSFCKGCMETFWQGKGSRECPVCRAKSSQNDPPRNLLLKNMCEAFLKEMKKSKGRKKEGQKKSLCSLHQSELKLFCEDDKQLLCLVCRDSKLHKHHNSSPIDEAALEHKETLRTTLKSLQDKLKTFNGVKLTCVKSAQHIKVQTQQTECQIKQEFVKLHQFLRNEEASRMAAIRREEKEKSQMMKEKIEEMSREISSLSDTIRTIEEELKADGVTFLQNYKSTEQRSQCTLQDPEKLSEALLNVAKHLGNLTFRVWEKMKGLVQFSPVILDPNTTAFVLSEDLTSVTFRQRQQLPDNPERIVDMVQGSEGFNTGTHYWDVEVLEDRGDWSLGLKGRRSQCIFWTGVYTYTGRKRPQKIRVQVVCERGEMIITDPDNNKDIFNFLHIFTDRMFPCFWPGKCSLRIVPVKPTIGLGENNNRTVVGQSNARAFSLNWNSCALL